MSGQSTGGPEDTEQAWISVEPSANYSYLYHYAYAGMRGLTLLEGLAGLPFNLLRIEKNNLGVMGASMGGQFTYYINGIDSRVKGAVAIAAAGDWHKTAFYPGAWLYHGLYYHTRDGLASGADYLNTVSNMCTDPTLDSFLDHFDPISYAPKQHGPLLTIIGSHDQYFTTPAINTTYDQTASAGTNARFIKRIFISPNGEHGVINQNDFITNILSVLGTANNWFKYCFRDGPAPPQTPTVNLIVVDNWMVFVVNVAAGGSAIGSAKLYAGSQIDTTPSQPNDFFGTTLYRLNDNAFVGVIAIGASPPSGPPMTPDNVLYFAQVEDGTGYTISSKMYRKFSQLNFCGDFLPVIEHFPGDSFPVQPPPPVNCACLP
jgi:dienelactone hydrolase